MASGVQRVERRPTWLPEQEWPFASRFVDVGEGPIHYLDEGTGPPLLFVNAGVVWSFAFRDLILGLRDRFRCVTLDFPGSGLSAHWEGYRPGLDAASGILDRFVAELGLQDVTLVVNDLRGPVAFGSAGRQPDLVRGMVVVEAFGWPLSRENPKVARMLRFAGGRMVGALNTATNLVARATSTSFGVGRHLSRAGRRAFRGSYRDRRVRRNGLLMLRDAATADPYLEAVDRTVRSALATKPVLLVFGERSPVRREGFPDQWRERFPDAPLVIVEGGHHFPQCDDPPGVANAIRSWWAAHVEPMGSGR
ncbi:MAG: alpha/beta fold hydrolase [Actinomycetota bacterium]